MARRTARLPSTEFEDETSLASIKRYVNFLIVKIDHVILDRRSALLDVLSGRGELSGFKLSYKIPKPARGNAQLDRDVLVNGDSSCLGRPVDQISFKHKKVFPIDLDSDLIEKWEQSTVQISLSAVTAAPKLPSDRKTTKHVARASVHLSELLSPPFRISRDCTMTGNDFTGRISLSIELGSRNVRVAEILTDLRRTTTLDETFTVKEEQPARRTRSRSASRCRSHSHGEDEENSLPTGPVIYVPKAAPRSRPSTAQSITDYTNHLNHRPASNQPISVRLENSLHPVQAVRSRPVVEDIHSDTDSVFAPQDLHSRPTSSRQHGALQLELTAHSARNLPQFQDRNGRWTAPAAFIQVLGREEQIMSTIAPANCNPIWNWTGKFVISSERGNVLVKILHKIGEQIAPIGVVTLVSPLQNFDESEFEISLTTENASGTSTITLSLDVHPFIPVSTISAIDRATPSRSSHSSFRTNRLIEHELPVDEPFIPYRRPRSVTPPRFMRAVSTETLRNRLKEDVDELLDAVNRLGRRQ